MYWLEVSVATDGEAAEAVAELLRPFAYSNGVVLEQLGRADDPAPDALEPTVTVKIYIPEAEDTPALRRRLEESLYHLGRLYPIPAPAFRRLVEEDWANAWKAHYHPFRIGNRIWIQPSWLTEPLSGTPDRPATKAGDDEKRDEDVVLTLDPGMAFGTGLHPTTQMCLQALEAVVRPQDRVYDVGTGSGILAIAAVKLGAAMVTAVDTDLVAVTTATENAAINQVQDRMLVVQGSLTAVTDKQWHVVVVNILAPVIELLLAEENLLDYVRPGGCLILSGIIEEQAARVATAVVAAGGVVERILQTRDWVCFMVKRPS
jgi:ribosomal protein L11 methyltransferase